MAELAWPEDIGHGTFTGRFGFMDADSHDPDRSPDITSATGGTVTITPSIKSVRYSGVQGPMILVARPARGVIDGEGYLCTATADGGAGDRGMVFPATDDTNLTPTDWTYEVSIILDGQVRVGTFSVKLPAGETVDLSLAVPVPSSGGTAVVVDPTTAERAEAAADRAETAADEAEGYAPSFVWDGTKLVIDGEPGPDLKGEQGTTAWAELTGKPATYPPTTHTHPITDVDGLKAIIDRLTYDSGWRVIPLRDGWTGEVRARRTANTVQIIINGIVRGEGAGFVAFDLPAGFGVTLVRPVLTDTSSPPTLTRTFVGGSTAFNVIVGVGESARYGSFITNAFDPIPTTLPGDPA